MAFQQRIYISSQAADRYLIDESRTDYLAFDLNEPIICKNNQKMYLSVETFAFPNTMYNITSANNTLIIDNKTLTIPVGQYSTASSLNGAIQTAITANGTITITSTYNALLNKIQFQNTSGTTAIVVSKDSTIGYRIGLLSETDLSISANQTIPLPRQVDVSNGRTINIAIQNLDFNGVDSNGQKTLSSILCSVPITASFGEIEGFVNPNNNKVLINTKNLTYFEIRLINLNNEQFDIGGLKWSMVLLVTVE